VRTGAKVVAERLDEVNKADAPVSMFSTPIAGGKPGTKPTAGEPCVRPENTLTGGSKVSFTRGIIPTTRGKKVTVLTNT